MTVSSRDDFLDCLKGFAICTVVLGHTFQIATADFDHYLPFRIIYSFHMPMFMFVAGMTASLSLLSHPNTESSWITYVTDVRSKALRLVLPFITWGVIQYFLSKPAGYNPLTWLLHLLQYPDDGLWFLWILFQISVLFGLVGIGIQRTIPLLAAKRYDGKTDLGILYLVLVLAWPVSSALVHALPNDLGLQMTKAFFPYFFLGFALQLIRPAGIPNIFRWIPYVVFVALAPFWYRTEISPVAQLFPNPGSANLELQRVVPLAGTFAFVDLVRLFFRFDAPRLKRAVAFVGKRSLDIYALHFYFLGYFPPLIAPIALSLGTSLILRTNFVTSWLCFGQRPFGIWQFGRDRLSIGLSGDPANKA